LNGSASTAAASTASIPEPVSSNNIGSSKQQLYEELRSSYDKLADIEFEFAKQNALSESTQVLRLQVNNFTLIASHFADSLPKLNDVLAKSREYCSAGSADVGCVGRSISRTKDEMLKYITEISCKIDLVSHC
jgi:hypothetical protein